MTTTKATLVNGKQVEDVKLENFVDVFQTQDSSEKSETTLVSSIERNERNTTSVSTHQWLKCMDMFVTKLKLFWEDTLKNFIESRGERANQTAEGVENDIIVALIDDGVNSCDEALAGRILDRKTFDYPTGYHRDRFFHIGAAHSDRTKFSWSGPTKELDFILPGVDIERGQSSKALPSQVNKEVESGSSIATALASGLAATVTYCVKTCALAILAIRANRPEDDADYSNILSSIQPKDCESIAEHGNMKAALARLGNMTEERFIPVWETIEPMNEVFRDEHESRKTKLEKPIELTVNLRPQRP